MEAIKEMLEVDFSALLITIITVILGLKAMASSFEWIIDKLGLETKWMREKRERSDLINKTAENLLALQKQHEKDISNSIKHDDKIEKKLDEFIDEMKTIIEGTDQKIDTFTQNRIKDREQSFKIQKELTDAQNRLSEAQNELSGLISNIDKKIDKMKKDTDTRFQTNEAKNNSRIRSEIKDRVSQVYRRHHITQKISSMELEALEGLIDSYEKADGHNSFIHQIVQKEMYQWKIEDN